MQLIETRDSHLTYDTQEDAWYAWERDHKTATQVWISFVQLYQKEQTLSVLSNYTYFELLELNRLLTWYLNWICKYNPRYMLEYCSIRGIARHVYDIAQYWLHKGNQAAPTQVEEAKFTGQQLHQVILLQESVFYELHRKA